MEGIATILALVALVAAWWLVAKKLAGKNWFLRHLAGSTIGVVALVLTMTLFVAFGLVDPEDNTSPAVADTQEQEHTPEIAPPITADALSELSRQGAEAELVSPAESDTSGYTVVSDEYHTRIKRTVLVALDTRVTEAELTIIAQAIKSQATHSTDRTFISYRVEGATSGMYWATTHYDSDLNIRIIGMTASEAEEAKAKPIPMFASVSEMIEDAGDYDEETGSYRLISENPLHIHLSPRVFKGDTAATIETELQRAVMYGIYKTFIHTKADQIRVSSPPIVVALNSISQTHQDSPRLNVNISRKAALEAIQQFLEVDDVQSLIEHEGSGGFTFVSWTPAFEQLYYEGNNPGLKKFFPELLARSTP